MSPTQVVPVSSGRSRCWRLEDNLLGERIDDQRVASFAVVDTQEQLASFAPPLGPEVPPVVGE